MHEVTTQTDIAATPERVWDILTDFAAYPEWNPFILSAEGDIVEGGRLKITVRPEGGRAMSFRPSVLVARTNKELRWLGRLLVPGLFDGEHYFRIEEAGPSRVRFIHGERFSGILVPLAGTGLEKGTKAGFIAMNEALKSRAERPPKKP